MSKIIHTDNYGGDYPNEKFVEGLPILPDATLQGICDIINASTGPNALRYYTVVPDDYELAPGLEP